jgi:hypothetical protein
MNFPFVSRAKYEALEDKLDVSEQRHADLLKRYEELNLHVDKLLDSMKPAAAEVVEQEEPMKPKRPLGREIAAMATADATNRYQQYLQDQAKTKPRKKKA